MLLFILLKLEVNNPYCIGFIYESCWLFGIILVNTEQWRAEIGSFNGCSQYLIVKLHLNLLSLLFSMFLLTFCIITITVCYITKLQIFLCLTTLFLCDFLAFLLASISYSNLVISLSLF